MEMYFINVIKTIAALLITNSHFDSLYPNPVYSTGGAIGNVLFCLVSGFCLSKAVHNSFQMWIWSRITRLYPTLWLGSIVWAVHNHVSFSLKLLLEIIVVPMKFLQFYWFIPAICCFYVVIYFVANYCHKHMGKVLFLLTLIYFAIYTMMIDKSMWIVEIDLRIKYVFYFMIMCLGYWLKQNWSVISEIAISKRKVLYGLFIISIAMFLGSKLLLNQIMNFQFIVQIATALVGLIMFLILATYEKQLYKYGEFHRCAKVISVATLEIYLMNFIIVEHVQFLAFPINVLMALALVFLLGVAMHYIAEKISALFRFIS